jgi:hypothetical protein
VTAPPPPPPRRQHSRRRQQPPRDPVRSGKRVASIEIDEALIEDALLRAGVLSRIDADDPSKVDAALSESVETWSKQQIAGRPARSCWWSTAARPARGRPVLVRRFETLEAMQEAKRQVDAERCEHGCWRNHLLCRLAPADGG